MNAEGLDVVALLALKVGESRPVLPVASIFTRQEAVDFEVQDQISNLMVLRLEGRDLPSIDGDEVVFGEAFDLGLA